MEQQECAFAATAVNWTNLSNVTTSGSSFPSYSATIDDKLGVISGSLQPLNITFVTVGSTTAKMAMMPTLANPPSSGQACVPSAPNRDHHKKHRGVCRAATKI